MTARLQNSGPFAVDADSDVKRIEIDRAHPNRVWWASGGGDKIGYVEVIE
jgi:hypothetical protein